MRVIRCHVDAPLSAGAVLRLPEEKSLHLLRVLRLREGDAVVLFNGDGANYPARIAVAAKRAMALLMLWIVYSRLSSPVPLRPTTMP